MARRVLAAACLAAVLFPAMAGGGDPRIAVILHRQRRDSLDTPTVASVYLRKRRFWDDGAPIIPVNRELGSPLRESFARRVFGIASSQLSAYWNEQYFHGVLPPVTLSSTQSIKRFVAEEPNAIGYVEAESVDDSVRVALMLE
jgi:ABC-type phosphate transport system substrate-binding protein